jgi:hypothetical protein
VLLPLVETGQHTSLTFTAELRETGIAGSIGTVGDALDNALCESTIGLFKTEAIDIAGATWTGRREVEWQVASWTAWYNTQRLHSSMGHRPPIECEHLQRQVTTVAPSQRSRNQPTSWRLRMLQSSMRPCPQAFPSGRASWSPAYQVVPGACRRATGQLANGGGGADRDVSDALGIATLLPDDALAERPATSLLWTAAAGGPGGMA